MKEHDPKTEERADSAPSSLPLGAAKLPVLDAARYQIQGLRGSGGQGRVLIALDSFLKREVALKVLDEVSTEEATQGTNAGLRPEEVQARFLLEAQVTGQLEHPNIVPVHDVGRTSEGALCYTMRLVRGQTLAEALDKCATLRDRLRYLGAFWDLGKAVSFAHSRGVLHRDLKPANVVVGEFGETMLLDWGVAKLSQDHGLRGPEIPQEQADVSLGTPAYMSPEQASDPETVDERADVWGLGAVLYKILTGTVPPRGESYPQMMAWLLKDTPVRPVRDVCPEAPAELAAVAERALQKNRALRYAKASQFTADIEAYMTGGRVRAYQYTTWELLRRLVDRHKLAFAACCVALVALLGSLTVVSLSFRSEQRARAQEGLARAQEHERRLTATYNLAQALAERAGRLAEDRQYLTSSLFAAASLLNNPAYAPSPIYSPDFASKEPRSEELKATALSRIYAARVSTNVELEQVLPSEESTTSMAFTPDGGLLVADGGAHVHLWDVATGQLTRKLVGQTKMELAVAASADGKWLASAGRDKVVVLWAASTGQRVERFEGHTDEVRSLHFSADSQRLASAGADGIANVWDLNTRRLLFSLRGHKEAIRRVAFSFDGSLLATASNLEGTARLWSAQDGRALGDPLADPGLVTTAAFSPVAPTLATGARSGEVRLWNAQTRTLVGILSGHNAGALDVAFSPEGTRLASVGSDNTVRLWSEKTREPLVSILAQGAALKVVAFSPDGRRFATAGNGKHVKVWRLSERAAVGSLSGHTDAVSALDFSPDGKLIVSAGGADRTVRVWDVASRRLLRTLEGHTERSVDNVAFAPEGNRVVSLGRDGSLRVWDVPTGQALHRLQGRHWTGLAVSPDGKTAAACDEAKVRLWNLVTGEPGAVLSGHSGFLNHLAFSPDGRLLASTSEDRTVRLWATGAWTTVREIAGHSSATTGVAFSRDGRKLASSDRGGEVLIWDTQSGTLLRRLSAKGKALVDVSLSPDGRLVAGCGEDGTLRVWSTESGQLQLLLWSRERVDAAKFSPEGSFLAVDDGMDVKLYPLDGIGREQDPGALLKEAERRAGLRLEGTELKDGSGD